MATQSSILAWRIPWIEEPSRLQPIGLQRVGHDCTRVWKVRFFFPRVLPQTTQAALLQGLPMTGNYS